MGKNCLSFSPANPKNSFDTAKLGTKYFRVILGFVVSEVSPIRFSRKPYTITYKDQNGEMQTIRRRPPPKLHDALPTDIVELTSKRNDDWPEGEYHEVKHINPRHPNVIQIVNDEGQSTFVDYRDIRIEQEVAFRNGKDPRDKPINNKYLLWP